MGVGLTRTVKYTCVVALSVWTMEGIARAQTYDPLRTPDAFQSETIELTVEDEQRDRQIPLKIYLPAATDPAPVILFSHGLGGTCNGCSYLGRHWSARGYLVVVPQHYGSDDAVWRDKRIGQRIVSMRRAGSAENLKLRVGDVHRVLDQLTAWNREDGHPLAQRMNLDQLGMSGHSFGAITAQVVGGQNFDGEGNLSDPRIRAVVALSPSIPREGDPKTAFEHVAIPWMLITGTKDVVTMFKTNLESRRSVYRNLPTAIDRYELVLAEAEHSAFTDVRFAWDRGERNPNHHRAVQAVSTAFWDCYLRANARAGAWLQGDQVRLVLDEQDEWQSAEAGTSLPEADEMLEEPDQAAGSTASGQGK